MRSLSLPRILIAAGFLVLPFIVPVTAPGGEGPPRLPVFASILPQAGFLERIGGDRLDVSVFVGENQSPHAFEPTPRQMAKLAAAKAYFRIGIPFETTVLRNIGRNYPDLAVVETQKGIPPRLMPDHHHDDGDRGRSGRKVGAGARMPPDPHVWMSPRTVKILAKNTTDALVALDAGHGERYRENLRAFHAELDRMDRRLGEVLAPLKGRKMYVFHPAFGYFTDAYGLIQVPVEMEGKEPGAKQLARLIERAKREGVKVLFVQPQFPAKSAEIVARAIGGAVVSANPLAKDCLSNFEAIAAAVERGLR